MLDDDTADFSPWTPAGGAALRDAAESLVTALREHAAAVSAVVGTEGTVGTAEVLAAGARLAPALLAYADAQFDHTGTWYPFGGIVADLDEDLDDDLDQELGPGR